MLNSRMRLVLLVGFLALAASERVHAADLDFAHGLYDQGRYALAAEEYQAFLKKESTGARADEATFFLAECELQLGRFPSAAETFSSLLTRLSADHPRYRFLLLRAPQALARAGRHDQAVPLLHRYLKEFPQADEASSAELALGESLLALGSLDHAERALSKAAQRASPAVKDTARLSLGRLARHRRDFAAAEQWLRPLAEDPKSPASNGAMEEWRQLRLEQGDAMGALALCDLLDKRSLSPLERERSALARARILERLDRRDEADRLLSSLLAKGTFADPATGPTAALLRGTLRFSQKDFTASRAIFREGARTFADHPSAAEFRFGAALSSLELREFAEARRDFQSLLDATPPFARRDEALYQLTRLAIEERKLDEAWSLHRRLVDSASKSPWRDAAGALLIPVIANDRDLDDRSDRLRRLSESMLDPAIRDRVDYARAFVEHGKKEPAKALALLDPILQRSKDHDLISDSCELASMCQNDLGRPDRAVRVLESGIAKTPSDSRPSSALLSRLVGVLARAPRSPELSAARERALARLRDRADAADLLTSWSDAELSAGHAEDAAALARQALERASLPIDRHRARLALAWALDAQGDSAAALADAQLVARDSKASFEQKVEAHYLAGLVAAKRNDPTISKEHFRQVETLAPQTDRGMDASRRLARQWAIEGKQTEATQKLEELARVAGQRPLAASILYDLAWLTLSIDPKQAVDRFAILAERFPGTPLAQDGLIQSVDVLLKGKNYQEAERLLNRLERIPLGADAKGRMLLRRAALELARSNPAAARSSLETILNDESLRRDRSAALLAMGESWLAERQADQAISWFERRLKEISDASAVAVTQGRIAEAHILAKRWDDARRAADRALQGPIDDLARRQAMFVQARCLSQQARFDDARANYDAVIEGARDELAAKSQFMIGESHMHQRAWSAALKAFLKVDILYPQSEWRSAALWEIGQCHEKLGERNEATDAYRKLATSFPMSIHAASALDRLKQLDSAATKSLKENGG